MDREWMVGQSINGQIEWMDKECEWTGNLDSRKSGCKTKQCSTHLFIYRIQNLKEY